MIEIWHRLQRRHSTSDRSTCLCCGRCCEFFGGHLQASKIDLQRWRTLGREDLLRRVNRLGWIWIDPETGRPETRCPFLVRTDAGTAQCAIHDIKPDICRAYPTLAHGRRCLRGVFLELTALAWWYFLNGSSELEFFRLL